MFALAFQRCVSREPKQELDRRQSAGPPGCPTAVRHLITGQCLLTRAWRIIRTAEEVCPFLSSYGSAGAARPCHMARTGHRPLGQAALSRAQAGAPGDATTLLLQPSWAFKGKKFEARLCKLFKGNASPVLFFPPWGPHEGPSLRPSRPSQVRPTYYSACWCLVCSPLVRSPRKLAAAAAAAPRVQPPPAPPLRPVGEN